MANLRIKGDVSGYVDLVAPDVAGAQTINLNRIVEVNTSGYIGVGTSTPTVGLEISGTGNTSRLKITDGTDQVNFGLWDGSNYRLEGDANRKILITSYHSEGIHLGANGASNLVVKDGKVGIGTTSPDLKLHVGSANAYPASSGSTPTGYISIRAKDTGGTHGAHIGVAPTSPWGTWIQAQDANNLSTNYPLLLNPNGGNVGIGITSPSEKLHLDSSTNTRLRISTTNTGSVPEIQLYNAVKEWKIGVETSTDSGGGAYSGAGASYFHIKNATDDAAALSFHTNGTAYFHGGTILWNNRENIGRVDQGNTGGLYISYGIQKFNFDIPSDNAWYNVLTNFRECTGYMWTTVSDASSRRKKVYEFNRTSPAYGVSTFSLVHDHGGGWNTGDFNFQVVSDGSSSFILQCQRSSYYNSANISNGRITILLF